MNDTGSIPEGTGLTRDEIDALFKANMLEIDKMNVAAGSMMKGLIMELQRRNRNTYIALRDAIRDGHAVDYTLVQGDQALVYKFAKRFGFKSATESRLEVRGG